MKQKHKTPPEGCMWDPWHNNVLVPTFLIQNQSRFRMELWDKAGRGHKFHYKNDPSYWWAEDLKRKRSTKK